VANFGFFLQITGLLLVLPIAIGLRNGELQAVSSLVATCFLAFGAGFVFNSFCERKELDDKASLWLMLLTFTVLPLLLMIPFIWNNVFGSSNPFDLFTNAYFETVSGFTTTGFSFVANPATLPSSLLFYRSLVEFIGGVGFIYILAAFLYPNDTLGDYAETFGVDKLTSNLRKVFLSVMLIYTVFVAVFTVIFFFTYSQDLVVAACSSIDVLTGGYQPNVTAGIGVFQISILVLMLLGSLNFQFHYNLFRLKFHNLITPEIKLYLEILVAAALVICFLSWVNPFESFFNVVSMASSTGIELFSIGSSSVPAKVLFILVGLAGGCAFSMAGGIRIQRIQTIINAVRKKGDQPTREELNAVLASVLGFIATLIVLSVIFSTIGVSMLDSVFEVGSALTTNGVSLGPTVTSVLMPAGYKWLLIIAMVVGRLEIVTIFSAVAGLRLLAAVKRVGGFLRKAIRKLPAARLPFRSTSRPDCTAPRPDTLRRHKLCLDVTRIPIATSGYSARFEPICRRVPTSPRSCPAVFACPNHNCWAKPTQRRACRTYEGAPRLAEHCHSRTFPMRRNARPSGLRKRFPVASGSQKS
jgi:trk system potassium uptake protein TrkH